MPEAVRTTETPEWAEMGDHSLSRFTVSQRVYKILRKAIISLRLRPGDALSEADMARKLGTSRQPVREAFIKLSEVDLVDIVPQRGTFVRKISSREVQNARFLRERVETALARRACEGTDPSKVDKLRAIVERQSVVADSNHDNFFELDDAFHEAVADCADCGSAWRLIDDLKAQMDRVRYMAVPEATPVATLIAQHWTIVAAISNRRADAAEAAMHEHLSELLASLPVLKLSHEELFSD